MPTLDDVNNSRHRHTPDNGRGYKSRRNGRRQGLPIDFSDNSSSILSPIISHLPSFVNMSPLKGFLPSSPQKASFDLPTSSGKGMRNTRGTKAVWQYGDIGDGRGRIPLLLVTHKSHALQVFTYFDSRIPNDPHIPETFSAPEEIVSIAFIKYDKNAHRSTLDGVAAARTFEGREQILDMSLMQNVDSGGGLLVATLVLTPGSRKAANGSLALVMINLRTGLAIRRVDLGDGNAGSIVASSKVIAVTVDQPIPAVHLFSSTSFGSLTCSPITQLASHPKTGLPVITLSGRLLAFTTFDPPRAPGAEGLGSIVSSSTLKATRSPPSERGRSDPAGNDTQAAIMSSAVEIGGAAARGVWAGIKMGAKAANRARVAGLAKSAPTDSSGTLAEEEDMEAETESRSLDDCSITEDMPSASSTSTTPGGEWIKIIDLFPRPASQSRKGPMKRSHSTSRRSLSITPNDQQLKTSSDTHETVAHFRLPISTFSLPIDPSSPQTSRRLSNTRQSPVTHLSFSPDGNHLFAAHRDGKVMHIVEIHPAGIGKAEVSGDVKGQVWHMYELRRGHTAAIIKQVCWDESGRWIGVATEKGTIHVFSINPFGGRSSASTHANHKIANPLQLQPLSTAIAVVARFRERHQSSVPEATATPANLYHLDGEAPFVFAARSRNPLSKSTYCQDIPIYRTSSNTFELVRLTTYPKEQLPHADTDIQSLQRRGSALTEMMKNKAFGEKSDLGIKSVIKAAWNLPEGLDETILLENSIIPPAASASLKQSNNLAHAEIRSHSVDRSIIPASVYLSRQVEFFHAKPIDEYSPLSILDLEARQRRLLFKKEVEAFSPLPEHIKPFDEPLLSALHSIMEERPLTQLPGLPNGSPNHSNKWSSTRIPIKTVAAGLNEGVDRVKREYVKAQYIRSRRRASEKAGLGLSFEDEDSISIHPSSTSSNEINSDSSPSSDILPTTETNTNTEPSDEEWNEACWEEEYNKAVEDDSPQELVLGLMDEEEEERRKWEIRREKLKKEYAK